MRGALAVVCLLLGVFYPAAYVLTIASGLDGRDYRLLRAEQVAMLAVLGCLAVWSTASGLGMAVAARGAKGWATAHLQVTLLLTSGSCLYVARTVPSASGDVLRAWLLSLLVFGLPLGYLLHSKRVSAAFPPIPDAPQARAVPRVRRGFLHVDLYSGVVGLLLGVWMILVSAASVVWSVSDWWKNGNIEEFAAGVVVASLFGGLGCAMLFIVLRAFRRRHQNR